MRKPDCPPRLVSSQYQGILRPWGGPSLCTDPRSLTHREFKASSDAFFRDYGSASVCESPLERCDFKISGNSAMMSRWALTSRTY